MPSLPNEISPPPNGPQASAAVYRFQFHGTGSDLFSIFILNLLKTILTLGVYHFWAKVKTRSFCGDRRKQLGTILVIMGPGWSFSWDGSRRHSYSAQSLAHKW